MNSFTPALLNTQKKMGDFPEKYNLAKLTQEEGKTEFPVWEAIQMQSEC